MDSGAMAHGLGEEIMKSADLAYRIGWIMFYVLAVVVAWNSVANESWRFMTETNRKLLAIIGLCMYVLLLVERKKRTGKTGWFDG